MKNRNTHERLGTRFLEDNLCFLDSLEHFITNFVIWIEHFRRD